MGDGLETNVDGTTHAMSALATTGEELNKFWRSADHSISWLSGILGNGPMGARFTSAYKPGRESLQHFDETTGQVPAELTVAGDRCIGIYATADAHAEAELLRVRFK